MATKKKPASKTNTAPEPMDDGIRERAVGAPSDNNRRVCWAIKQLVREVTDLFPETAVEYSNYDGRSTALDVTFGITGLPEDDREAMKKIMLVLPADEYNRVWHVDAYDTTVLVQMHPRPRTQDIREPFGIEGVYMILADNEQADAPDPTSLAARGRIGSPTYFGDEQGGSL